MGVRLCRVESNDVQKMSHEPTAEKLHGTEQDKELARVRETKTGCAHQSAKQIVKAYVRKRADQSGCQWPSAHTGNKVTVQEFSHSSCEVTGIRIDYSQIWNSTRKPQIWSGTCKQGWSLIGDLTPILWILMAINATNQAYIKASSVHRAWEHCEITTR